MPNPQDIFQLAQQTATQVTASPENWRRFLYTAAQLPYHLPEPAADPRPAPRCHRLRYHAILE